MDLHQKIDNLKEAAGLDCEGSPPITNAERKAQFVARSRAFVTHPQRGKMPVMRVMQTSACEHNCRYCPFQAGQNYRRVWLKPEELALAFDQMQRKKLVDGLFLSSGIIGGGVESMSRMLDTVDLVRRKYEYRGYIHLKIMPGAEAAQIERAARLADRLSINLEGANETRLPLLAPKKDFTKELLPPLYWVQQNRVNLPPWVKPPSLTTQYVVGPAGESDRELLTTVDRLYRQAGLARAYYSPFNPIPGTAFEHKPKTNLTRQQRLYQADWLLRFYGFTLSELPFDETGKLPLARDPKIVWAETHLRETPLEINRANRAELLRVPGLGPKTVEAILAARRQSRLVDLPSLRKLGAHTQRMTPYVLVNGRRPDFQLTLPGWSP